MQGRSAAAIQAVERETSVSGVLRTMCREVTELVGGDGCNVSRVIGLLLVDLVDYSRDGRRLQLGRGYLIPDFPLTQEVIDEGDARTVSTADPDADPSEVALLRELRFEALLMLPLEVDNEAWGLVEIYRSGDTAFGAAEIGVAHDVVAHAARRIAHLQPAAAA